MTFGDFELGFWNFEEVWERVTVLVFGEYNCNELNSRDNDTRLLLEYDLGFWEVEVEAVMESCDDGLLSVIWTTDDGSFEVNPSLNEVKLGLSSEDETSLHWTLSEDVEGEIGPVNLLKEMKRE